MRLGVLGTHYVNPQNGYCVLHYLMEHNVYDGCQTLSKLLSYLILRKEISVNSRSLNGVTPLMIARKLGNYQAVQLLLKTFQADPTLLDKDGHDAMWYESQVWVIPVCACSSYMMPMLPLAEYAGPPPVQRRYG
jgi:hypothetical protein